MKSGFKSTHIFSPSASSSQPMLWRTERRYSGSSCAATHRLCLTILADVMWSRFPPDIAGPTGEVRHVLDGEALRHHTSTVEPLSNDHPHQRPSLLYDHISCDGQCFLFVRFLTNDHPSNATNDRVRWNFLPRGRPYRVFQNECVMNIR